MNTQTTPNPTRDGRSVAALTARARDAGVLTAIGVVAVGWWARRRASAPVLVMRQLRRQPDSTALALSQATPLKVVPLVPLLSVLDHLVLSRAVSARWVGPDEGGPRRRVYRVTDGEAVAC